MGVPQLLLLGPCRREQFKSLQVVLLRLIRLRLEFYPSKLLSLAVEIREEPQGLTLAAALGAAVAVVQLLNGSAAHRLLTPIQ